MDHRFQQVTGGMFVIHLTWVSGLGHSAACMKFFEEKDFITILWPILVNGLIALPTCIGAPAPGGEGGEGNGYVTHFVDQT